MSGTGWQSLVGAGINSGAEAESRFGLAPGSLDRAAAAFPARINSYFLGLIGAADDPLGRQVVPSPQETADTSANGDPLSEDDDSPVPHLVHRYPDRVLLLATYQCAVYCRFCTRRRAVGRTPAPTGAEMDRALSYITAHTEIRDVIVSGGDPLMLSDAVLGSLLARIRAIPHVEIIRVDSRIPGAMPARITPELCAELRRHHPLYINTHFNHPRELTNEARAACARLADAGIPLGNQTVLLRGVNDDAQTMKQLVNLLLAARIKPYYLYQCDPVAGTEHFRTTVQEGLEIISALRGHTSGMAVPAYVIDAPGGGGKVPALPPDVLEITGEKVVVRNYEGKVFEYRQAEPGIK
jgi:lysine 2,3-aminomutase